MSRRTNAKPVYPSIDAFFLRQLRSTSKLDLMKALPQSITERAYVSPGAKEFAWRRHDMPAALQAIAASGQAILGGEVWIVKDPGGNWHGLIPSKTGGPDGVWHWETTPKKDSESWQLYCERTQQESLNTLKDMRVENETREDVVPLLWFNVSFVGPHEV